VRRARWYGLSQAGITLHTPPDNPRLSPARRQRGFRLCSHGDASSPLPAALDH
jgi:hypothetical protein